MSEKLSLSLILPDFLMLAQIERAINSNDNYIHKVSENTSFILVDFVDLKIFKFKSRKLFLGHAVD